MSLATRRRIFDFLFLLSIGILVVAQEKPAIITKQYDPRAHYRQNVCDRHASYYAGKVELRHAIEGLRLRPLISVSRLFPLDDDGAIDPDDPGIVAVLLDELGKRSGFTWRHSYAVTYGPGEGHTYTEMLVWATESFDLAVDWYYNSLERLKLGVGFPRGFYDGSYILVGKEMEVDAGHADLFGLLKPFKPSVWWTIIGTVLASAVVYMVLENLNRQVKHKWALGRNIFYSMLMFTQHFQFHPKSHAARLFSVSLAFWSLIIVATYTANLASVFVIQSAPVSQISGIQDVVRAGLPICVPAGWGSTDFVKAEYPTGVYVDRESEEDCFAGVTDDECAFALTSVRSWEQFEKDRNINGECDLAWVGRIITFIDAGFGIKVDSGIMCTSLIQDVLNLHLVEMHADGFIERAWKDFMKKHQDIDCNVEESAQRDQLEAQRLSLHEMSGTFFLHLIGIILALIITVVRRFRVDYYSEQTTKDNNRGGDDESDDLNSVATHNSSLDDLDDENEEAISVFELQLQEYRENQKAIEKQFHDDMREQQQQISTIISILQNKTREDVKKKT